MSMRIYQQRQYSQHHLLYRSPLLSHRHIIVRSRPYHRRFDLIVHFIYISILLYIIIFFNHFNIFLSLYIFFTASHRSTASNGRSGC